LASEQLARQPPQQIGRCAASSGQEHHWGMMRGGGGGKIGGIGPSGDEFSYTMGLRASMDHEDRHRPTAAIGPRSRRRSIQQSANIICNSSTLLKLENILFINVYTTI
jgi:hypothetical protein